MNRIICPDCQGKGGWGHYDDEPEYFRSNTRARKETFFPCATCHGHGTIEPNTNTQEKETTWD